ncbi:CopG family antitoxin [Candidatus Margulisiibacteriota bacterium]
MNEQLTIEEQELEKIIEQFASETEEEKQGVNSASNKKRTITLRINDDDLIKIKHQAEKEGLAYQTFINSILHKYITHQLLDEKHVHKLAEIISQSFSK